MRWLIRRDGDSAKPPCATNSVRVGAVGVMAMRNLSRLAALSLKLPIHLYRFTLKPFFGWQCRHLPTCSDYALQAIDRNGAWRGSWLIVSRLARCQPWGTSGYDPVPDLRSERFVLAPWRYGRWPGLYCPSAGDPAERESGAARSSPDPNERT